MGALKRETQTEAVPVREDKSKGILRRLFYALGYSLSGLAAAFRHEAAFRTDVLLAVVMIVAAILLPVSLVAKAILIASVLLILIVELLNSAVESAIDYISLDTHPLAKRAKDMGSAAVFLSLVTMVVVWLLVLWECFVR